VWWAGKHAAESSEFQKSTVEPGLGGDLGAAAAPTAGTAELPPAAAAAAAVAAACSVWWWWECEWYMDSSKCMAHSSFCGGGGRREGRGEKES
jgi:hypothetical protein